MIRGLNNISTGSFPSIRNTPSVEITGKSSSKSSRSASVSISDFDQELIKLDAYRKEREATFQEKFGNQLPQNTVAVAVAGRPDGGRPFITADQQRNIDQITDKYRNRTDFANLFKELSQNGVHPDQIAASAKYWVYPGARIENNMGELVSRLSIDVKA